MDKICVEKINDIIDYKIKSKAISVYFFIVALADQDYDTNRVSIINFNINRIVRSMNAHGIKTTHRQVSNSIDELLDKGFISYPFIEYPLRNKSVLELHGFDFGSTKSNAFVYLSELMLNYNFYKMNIRSKRIFLDIYKTFIIEKKLLLTKKVYRNILKKETFGHFSHILSINRYAKLRDALDALNGFFEITLESKYSGVETYSFKLTKEFYRKLLYISKKEKPIEIIDPNIDETKIVAYSILSFKELELYSSQLKPKINQIFLQLNYKPSKHEIGEILKSTFFFNKTQLKLCLEKYIRSRKIEPVRYIYRYFKRIAINLALS